MLYSVLVLAVLTTAQSTPQSQLFSGIWILDASQSILFEGGGADTELIVTEGPASLAVTQRTPRSEEKYSAALDGTPKEDRGPSSAYLREVRRENGALVWKVKMTRLADQASISFTERWTLSSDGNVLTVLRNYPGRQVLKIFRRKK